MGRDSDDRNGFSLGRSSVNQNLIAATDDDGERAQTGSFSGRSSLVHQSGRFEYETKTDGEGKTIN